MTDDIDEFMRKFKERVDSRPTIPIPPKDTAVKVTTVHFPSFIKKKEPFEPAKILPIIPCGCGDPTLEYRSASGSKAKCGWAGFEDADKRYLLRTVSVEYSGSSNSSQTLVQTAGGALRATFVVFSTSSYSYSYGQRYNSDTCAVTCEDLDGESESETNDTISFFFPADPSSSVQTRHTTCSSAPSAITVCLTSFLFKLATLVFSGSITEEVDCSWTPASPSPAQEGDADCLCNGGNLEYHPTPVTTPTSGTCPTILASSFADLVETINSDTDASYAHTRSVSDSGSDSSSDGCLGNCDRTYSSSSESETTMQLTLSDEYTTSELKSNTTSFSEDDYTDWGDGDTSSYANLSVSELNYSATESQVRILHEGSCYLKVWLRTAFTPDGGGAVQYADLATYEFTAETEGDHESPAYTNTVPDENGTKTVEMKFICTEGEDEPAWP